MSTTLHEIVKRQEFTPMLLTQIKIPSHNSLKDNDEKNAVYNLKSCVFCAF